jgi:quinol monooxygenase YgiN
MMLEHAVLTVRPGSESDFEAAMREALPIIEGADECFGAEVRRQAEDPSVFLLLVRWSSVAAHMAFRATPRYEAWRALTHHFYVGTLNVTHFFEPIER